MPLLLLTTRFFLGIILGLVERFRNIDMLFLTLIFYMGGTNYANCYYCYCCIY